MDEYLDKMEAELAQSCLTFDKASENSSHSSSMNSAAKSLGAVQGNSLRMGVKWHDLDEANPMSLVVPAFNLFILHSRHSDKLLVLQVPSSCDKDGRHHGPHDEELLPFESYALQRERFQLGKSYIQPGIKEVFEPDSKI